MKEKNQPTINEDKLMEMMSHSFSEQPTASEKKTPQGPKPKAEIPEGTSKMEMRSHPEKPLTYQELFLRESPHTARSGKSVYIRPEYHERLTRIVQVIGENKVSLFSYLDHVLQHHFTEFEKPIKKQFKEKYKPIL